MAIRAIDSSTLSWGQVYPTTIAIAPPINRIKPKTVSIRQSQSPVRCAGGGGKRYLNKNFKNFQEFIQIIYLQKTFKTSFWRNSARMINI